MQIFELDDQLCWFGHDSSYGKTSRGPFPRENLPAKIFASFRRRLSTSSAINYQFLDLTPGAGNLLGESYWETLSPYVGGSSTLNTGASPKDAVESSLSQILEDSPPSRYYLSRTACLGILRRASERGKELPPQLKTALMMQAGLSRLIKEQPEKPVGFDGYNGDLTGDKAATLGENCGMSTGRNGVIAFAANQRDEVRDLHDVAGVLGAQPGMKQQTFVAAGVVTKGNGDCFLTPDKHTSLTSGGGQAGQGYPCVLTASLDDAGCLIPEGKAPAVADADSSGSRNPFVHLFTAAFSAGAGASAGSIGYIEEGSPTLKGSEGGNMVPAILCLNDQGGKRMDAHEEVAGTLRSQEHGHQPLVMATQQGSAEIGVGLCPTITLAAGTSGNNQPVLFENYGIDARYTGPHPVAPTMSARYGTGGNNVPLVSQEAEAYCITGNAIDRQPQNGGNGIGYQPDIAYTLTATDHHAVFSRQRVDRFRADHLVSTESARQKKDVTDVVLQKTVGKRGQMPRLIRRLTPLECERLQGFPDGWTNIPGASDSARYKALGNSVAIPCVEYVMAGIAAALTQPSPPLLPS